jgi:hypothetical protein
VVVTYSGELSGMVLDETSIDLIPGHLGTIQQVEQERYIGPGSTDPEFSQGTTGFSYGVLIMSRARGYYQLSQ